MAIFLPLYVAKVVSEYVRFAFYVKSGIIYKSRICAYIFGVHINKEGVYVRKFWNCRTESQLSRN